MQYHLGSPGVPGSLAAGSPQTEELRGQGAQKGSYSLQGSLLASQLASTAAATPAGTLAAAPLSACSADASGCASGGGAAGVHAPQAAPRPVVAQEDALVLNSSQGGRGVPQRQGLLKTRKSYLWGDGYDSL